MVGAECCRRQERDNKVLEAVGRCPGHEAPGQLKIIRAECRLTVADFKRQICLESSGGKKKINHFWWKNCSSPPQALQK